MRRGCFYFVFSHLFGGFLLRCVAEQCCLPGEPQAGPFDSGGDVLYIIFRISLQRGRVETKLSVRICGAFSGTRPAYVGDER